MTFPREKRVLMLGAGMSTGSACGYFAKKGLHVTVATRTIAKAEAQVKAIGDAGTAVTFDIESENGLAELGKLCSEVGIVLSFLPYIHHVKVAKVAIEQGIHFVAASYIAPEMDALDSEFKRIGKVCFNECGVDPGLDHMSAKKVIDEAHEKGGKVVEFTSFCGGLPAPEANTNPFGYKLSWSPRGVLLASRNVAKFLKDGKVCEYADKDNFQHTEIQNVPGEVSEGGGDYEAYANRDSTKYIDIYGVPEARTFVRGTYRNVGWCPTLVAVMELGYLSLDEQDLSGLTFAQLTLKLAAIDGATDAKAAVSERCNLAADSAELSRLEWVGLFSDQAIPAGTKTYLDALTFLMDDKLQFAENERDMIVMQHRFLIEYPDHKERVSSSLVAFGIPGDDTAMGRTVSLPAAIAVAKILSGEISTPGVFRPVAPELYNPILKEVSEDYGITFVEKSERV